MKTPIRCCLALGMLAAVLAIGGVHSALAETTLTLWSHEADEAAKVAWAETAARNFEKKNPGVTVKMTWYQKEALNAALKAALRAGQGPDILYTEPDQTEYIDNGFLLPLNDFIDWNNVEAWAREAWTHNGKVYGLPKEAYTIELYYNKDWMKKLGVNLPANGQVSQAEFLQIVKKAVAAGMTPIAQGVGDRPFPGAYLTHEAVPAIFNTRMRFEATHCSTSSKAGRRSKSTTSNGRPRLLAVSTVSAVPPVGSPSVSTSVPSESRTFQRVRCS